MRTYIDEETGSKMCEPDCADEWLFNIWALGMDYDGCRTVEEFKELVDELVGMSKKARECLWDIKLFGVHGSPYKNHWVMEKLVEKTIDEDILDKYNNLGLTNAISDKEIEEGLKEMDRLKDGALKIIF
jgi:hypothetical protein